MTIDDYATVCRISGTIVHGGTQGPQWSTVAEQAGVHVVLVVRSRWICQQGPTTHVPIVPKITDSEKVLEILSFFPSSFFILGIMIRPWEFLM
jgi:hypothetical protein